jgi:hypothetical protein
MALQEKNDSEKDHALQIAEYNALRGEIVKRMDVESQFITFTVIVFGTLVSVGVQNKIASLLLLYPLLALFFAIGWSHSDYRVRQIGTYIKNQIEGAGGKTNIGWEHYLEMHPYSRYYWMSRGIFLSTQVVAIIIGVSLASLKSTWIIFLLLQPITNADFVTNTLLILTCVSFFLTVYILRQIPISSITSSVQPPSDRIQQAEEAVSSS